MNKLLLFLGANLLACMASALTVEVMVLRHSYCGRASGLALASVSGGVPPYTYEWSDGSTDWQALGLLPGNHSLTVTDSQLDQATATFTIDLLNSYEGLNAMYSLAHCANEPAMLVVYTGMEADFQQPAISSPYGPNPYSFSHPLLTGDLQAVSCAESNSVVYHMLAFQDAQPGTYTIDFADADGCPGQITTYLAPEMPPFPNVQVVDVQASCASTPTGSITFSYEGWLNHQYIVKLRPAAILDDCAPQVYQFGVTQGPGGTRTVTDLLPGDYYLIKSNDIAGTLANTTWSGYICKDSVLVTVPSLGVDCGVVSGRVYLDDDVDCALDGIENRVPGTIVEITPGPVYVTTDNNGRYSVALNFGDYTVAEQNANYVQSCPGALTLASGAQTFNLGCAGGQPLDVQLTMANGPARPGFELHYAIAVDNLTPASTGVVTVTATLDPVLGFLSANPAPTSVVGNVLTWTSPQFVMNQVFQHRDITVRTQVPSDVGLIGSTLITTAQITTTNSDGDLTNNSSTSAQLVTGSFDPNDKLATTSTGGTSVWTIEEDEWIDYTIRFQNTGTDTAFNVVITDTLPQTLDPGTIVWGASSHVNTRSVFGQGVIKFVFANILLPDSNVNEPMSHGFVSFRIRPHLPIAPGTVIENIAKIYFDFNPPVITEPSVLVAEFSTGIQVQGQEAMLLQPNPVSQVLSISASSAISSLRIISADGRSVHAQRVRATTAVVDVAALKAGAYLLIVELNDGTTARERFIKQ